MYVICTIKQYLAVTMSHGAGHVGAGSQKQTFTMFYSCIITEKAPTWALSWLKAATTALTFKTLLRHYAKTCVDQQQRGLLCDRKIIVNLRLTFV